MKLKLKKKSKEERPYVLKKTGGLKALRICFWGILLFLTVRGALDLARPDQTQKVREQVDRLESSMKEEFRRNTEILSFAEEFAREWQTYTEEEEFKGRLAAYVVPEVLQQQGLHDFSGSSTVEYAKAYRIEEQMPGHYDVFVEVGYTYARTIAPEAEGTGAQAGQEQAVTEGGYVFRTPVQVTEEGKYIVEGIPMAVEDTSYLSDSYQKEEIQLEELENIYQETITNYLKAYFGEEASVVEYFLSEDARQKKPLYGYREPGTVELLSVDQVKAYRRTEGEVLCLVDYRIRNTDTQETFLQQSNITLDDSEAGRLYVKAMGTKIFNLNVEVEQ